ncbi:unnamed protein product [Notodromas monacha]|uniref:Uncharacterized protein n=1 Tax=Notodromas monacha TaxID=399045 RepID=A0A7R9BUI4_9CRUS|nr:unnamed protein product [Notodromas monacha]CAG0920919.1 unnamed protein product [Notodromas monacha]
MDYSRRNPSPPLNLSVSDVVVGDTLYSQSFICTVLLDWMNSLKENYVDSAGDGDVEIDPCLEDKLCQLWDMTFEAEVAKMLIENELLLIVSQTLEVSKSPRLKEIALGILANALSVSPSLRRHILLDDMNLVERVLGVLFSSDSRIVYEGLRVLNSLYYDMYADFVDQEQKGYEHVCCLVRNILGSTNAPNVLAFILGSSVMDDVLCQTLRFLTRIISLEVNDTAPFVVSFSDPGNFVSVMEAMNQLKVSDPMNACARDSWLAGVDAMIILATVVSYGMRIGHNLNFVPSDELSKVLAGFIRQCGLQVDRRDENDLIQLQVAVDSLKLLCEGPFWKFSDFYGLASSLCALTEAIGNFSKAVGDSSVEIASKLMELSQCVRFISGDVFQRIQSRGNSSEVEKMAGELNGLQVDVPSNPE